MPLPAAGTLLPMTNTINAVVDTYIASWNEGDEARRRELVAQAFTDDARYLDPLMAGEGTDGITARSPAAPTSPPSPMTGACVTSRASWRLRRHEQADSRRW